MKKTFASLICVVAVFSLATVSSLAAQNEFDALTEGQTVADFRLKTMYENEYGDAVGAEFRHVPSGFVLDILRIQSLPQGFIWVNSPPSSDAGEPHAMEHLVLGKGTKAQWVASFEDMSLSSSSAMTGQTITGYHFYSSAGKDVFFQLMEVKLDALIHPDYSDEEIRREMCNLGYSINPEDSSYRLEEKGTVYTEMVSYFEGTWDNVFFKLGKLMYGSDHPLSNDAGGYPPAIRQATAEGLRKFQEKYYHLNNIGMIVAIPDEIALEELLSRTSEIFNRIEPDAKPGEDPATVQERFPKPAMAPVGTIAIADFPHQNEKEPGMIVMAWPPVLDYDFNEALLCDVFVYNLAVGETSNLYKKFIDSQTRQMDIGASDVSGWANHVHFPRRQGCPIYIDFSDVSQNAINQEVMDSVRTIVMAEIESIAGFPDGSEELRDFNGRVADYVSYIRRDLRNRLNRPPRFGFRGADFWWVNHLHELYRTPGFRKKLTTNARLEFIENLLASGRNFWKDYIQKWKLLDNKPYVVGARANPDMISRTEEEREKRIGGHIEDLKKKYGVDNRETALAKFVAEYDAKTAAIDEKAAAIETPGFIDNPPLTLDPQLPYRVEKFPGGGDNVVSTFNNITSAEMALFLDMSVVPESLLVYVSALPTMLTGVGVIKDGQPLAYDATSQRLTKDILRLSVDYDVNYRTERVELEMIASGSTLEEAVKGAEWLSTFLHDPDWRLENLPRMRDALDIALTSARNGMKGSEEYWVNTPANGYWKQTNPLILSALCFLTKQHSLMRVKWMLHEAPSSEARQEFEGYMTKLADLGRTADRSQLAALATRISTGAAKEEDIAENNSLVGAFEALSKPVSALVKAAADDLIQCLAGLPDGALAGDWQYLCRSISADLALPPSQALDNLKLVMATIRKKDNVRGYLVGSETSQQTLLPLQNGLVETFSDAPSVKQVYSNAPVVNNRLSERVSAVITPLYVGLINENTRNGVFVNSAPCVSYLDTDGEKLLDFLATRLYGGSGSHSVFMKTWAAGLAYSNGLRTNQYTGRQSYYAERCPSLVQTMQFVVNEVKNAEPDTNLAEYAVAQAFLGGRAGSTYENRTARMAADLADGLTPEKVAAFRSVILELRKRPDLYEQLTARMLAKYGQVLLGLDPPGADIEGAIYFMIAPEMQFEALERYLKTVEGEDVTLHRIYPRDYWIVAGNEKAF